MIIVQNNLEEIRATIDLSLLVILKGKFKGNLSHYYFFCIFRKYGPPLIHKNHSY